MTLTPNPKPSLQSDVGCLCAQELPRLEGPTVQAVFNISRMIPRPMAELQALLRKTVRFSAVHGPDGAGGPDIGAQANGGACATHRPPDVFQSRSLMLTSSLHTGQLV